MIDADLHATLENALRGVLGNRLVGIEAGWGVDHYGEPALNMVVNLQSGIPRLGGELTTDAVHVTRQTLLKSGFEHFPLMTFVYADEEAALDEDFANVTEAH